MQLKLEKFTLSDFHHYFSLVSNQRVMEMITERAIELDEAKGDYDKIIENNKINKDFGNFKILDRHTKDFIGLAKLEAEALNFTEAEIGYMILPAYWRKGVGTEVTKQLIGCAIRHNLKRITAIIDPKNLPSRKILINNGFKSVIIKEIDGLPGEILGLEL